MVNFYLCLAFFYLFLFSFQGKAELKHDLMIQVEIQDQSKGTLPLKKGKSFGVFTYEKESAFNEFIKLYSLEHRVYLFFDKIYSKIEVGYGKKYIQIWDKRLFHLNLGLGFLYPILTNDKLDFLVEAGATQEIHQKSRIASHLQVEEAFRLDSYLRLGGKYEFYPFLSLEVTAEKSLNGQQDIWRGGFSYLW